MHSLFTRSCFSPARRTVQAAHQTSVPAKRAPRLSHRQHRASYYFDAPQHTSLSFRLLLSQLKAQQVDSQQRRTRDFLCLSMDNLLASIRPGLDDDAQSQHYFFALLHMHLSHLTSDEIAQLCDTLKTAQFSCHVVETIIDDEVYRDYGFANGPPHSFNRTLMQTQDFFNHLEGLKDSVQQFQRMPLQADLAASARHALSASIGSWMQSDKTLNDLQSSVCLLAEALDMSMAPTEIITGSVATKSTTVIATQKALTVDACVTDAMLTDTTGRVFSEWLRDVLELLLTQKLFGIAAPPDTLARMQRQQLCAAIEQIYAHMPVTRTPELRRKACSVLKEASHFGEIQIQPTTGVALGHAWITPSLSLVPDKRKNSVDIGHRFMHSGGHLAPGDSQIREWPTHFMTEKESEETYPSQHAWFLRVPVDARRLQLAAQKVRHEWESLDLPYRFIGTTPGMPATGCRATVWEAVQRGMTDDALALFQHYNSGLPEPQSPTELWQRLDGLMRWMEALAHD